MFDKKYKKALKILDDEIVYYERLFRDTLDLAGTAGEDDYDEYMYTKSGEYLDKRIALTDLRRKLSNTLGDL